MKIAYRVCAVAALVLAGCPTPPPAPDTTPPTVTRTVPDRDALGVATNAKLTVDFSEAMDPSSLTTDSFQLLRGSSTVSGAVAYEDATHQAVFTPVAPLDENAEYTATLTSAVRDPAGNALAAAYTWKFTTVGNAPHVVSTTPADGATGVARELTIKFQFDKDINPASVSANLLLTDAASALVPATSSYDATTFTATLSPNAPLPEGKTFTATAKAGILGTNGLMLPADKVVTFTVINDAPQVTSTTPSDQAMNVALDTPITAHFSEPVSAMTMSTASYFLKEGTNMLSATVMLDGARTTATLVPSSPLLEGRTYTATLTTDVQDDYGNPMAAAKAWQFATLTTIPTVTMLSPMDLAQAVAGNTPVGVTFSEDMDEATVTSATSFEVKVASVAVLGTRTYDAPSRTVTFQPTGAYPGGATVSVHVTPGAKDPSGFGLAADFNASFTVSNAPSVTASTPAPNDANVPLGSGVSLTFSTAMDTSTLTAANVWVEDAMMNKVAGSYTASPTSLIISPSLPLAELKTYTVVVTVGARSATQVPFAAAYRFNFTTSPVPPVVVSTSPTPGASDIAVTAPVNVVFDKDMDTTSFVAASLVLSDGANNLAGAVSAVDARTLRFTPTAPLHELRQYTATVNGVADLAGAPIAAPYVSSFTTEALPRLTGVAPLNGSTGVAPNAHLALSFNKDIASTIAVTGVGASSTSAVTLVNAAGARVDGAVTYFASTFTADIRPQASGSDIPWTASSRYTVLIDGTKLLDAHGNAVGGSLVLSFVTGAAADSAAPTLVTSSPLNGATGVSRTAALWAQLSEPLAPSSVSAATVKVLNGTTPLAGALSYDPSTLRVSFTPAAPLPAATTLTFQLGAVMDLSGNPKASLNTIGFTTADNAAPSLLGSAPAGGATNVNVNTKLRLAFSERINPQSLSLTADNGSPLSGTTSYDDATASAVFVPSSNLPGGATINVTVAAGLADLEGKATVSPLTFSFQTIASSAQDVTAPTVSSSTPANMATQVSSTQVVSVQFSEAMLPSSLVAANVTLKQHSGAGVWATLAFDAAGDRLTLTPGDRLKGGVQYDVVLSGALKDLAGNALAPTTLTFTVENVRPTVQSTSPAAMSTVGSGVQLSVVFSEGLDPATLGPSTLQVSFNSMPVLGAVSYDASSHTALFQPSKALADGVQTVTLGAAITDLAGNALMASPFTFTVSSAGPSVSAVAPCGMQVDADDFGTQVVTLSFDRNVRKSGGGALDGTALKLQLGGMDQAVTVGQTVDTAIATLTPSSPLQAGQTYTVVANAQVVASNNGSPMASTYSCTFTTQKVLFQDGVNDTSTAGYTLTAAGTNAWQRINSGDDARSSIVWRGGNPSDGQSYLRDCRNLLGGNPGDYTVIMEKQVDLTGYSSAEVRFQVMDDIQRSGVDDQGRFIVNDGTDHILTTYTGQNAANPYVRQGKGSGNLTPFVNKTVKIRWELLIRGIAMGIGQSCANNNIAGRKGLFVDDILVVGQ